MSRRPDNPVLRAVGYFTGRYGKIDWIESNNEYWLELDAALRTDFNVTSGLKTADMARIKHKSVMKEYYRKAGEYSPLSMKEQARRLAFRLLYQTKKR